MPQSENQQFENLEAVSLYCPRCKTAMPVRKRLLLVLPESEMYEYLCARCGASVGKKNEPVSRRSTLPDLPRI